MNAVATVDRLEEPASPAAPPDPFAYLSASRLNTWQTCRLQFFYKYVEGLPTRTTASLFIGKTVHFVLQRWNLSRWRGEPHDQQSLWPEFSRHWLEEQPEEGIDWKGKETQHREKTWALVTAFLEQTTIPADEKPEAVEVEIECDLPEHGIRLLGYLDLVRGGGVIVDFKTASRAPDQSLAALRHATQLSVYGRLYRDATGSRESGFELHHLIGTKEPEIRVTRLDVMTPAQEDQLHRLIEAYLNGVHAGEWIPSPGMHCRWCDYFHQCRQRLNS